MPEPAVNHRTLIGFRYSTNADVTRQPTLSDIYKLAQTLFESSLANGIAINTLSAFIVLVTAMANHKVISNAILKKRFCRNCSGRLYYFFLGSNLWFNLMDLMCSILLGTIFCCILTIYISKVIKIYLKITLKHLSVSTLIVRRRILF